MTDRRRRGVTPGGGPRVAYAELGHGERCAICNTAPCVGHSQSRFLPGLVAAGLLLAAPARPVNTAGAVPPHLRAG